MFGKTKHSFDRLAWTATEEQGRGNGLNSYKHKQPTLTNKDLQRDYYVKTGGKQ